MHLGETKTGLSNSRWFLAVVFCFLAPSFLVSDDGRGDRDKAPAKTEKKESKPQRVGRIIQVSLPIEGNADIEIRQKIDRVLEHLKSADPRPILVLQFNTKDGQTGKGSQFERSLSVARYLSGSKLRHVRTIAYLPDNIQGHAVLVALACEEIIMHPDARFGGAGIDELSIDDTMRHDYSEIAGRRGVIPSAFAVGMLDSDLAVYRLVSDGGRYVMDDELRKLQAEGKANDAETVIEAGQLPDFSGSELRHKFRFVSYLANDRKELLSVLNLPLEALEGDPSAGGDWRAVRVDLRGQINQKNVNWIQQSLNQHLRSGENPNFICVWIDSPGGSPKDSIRLAFQLAELDPETVRTVAYVPFQARADAALVALACDQIVMESEAVLGGPGSYQMSEEEQTEMRETLKDLASKKGQGWSLCAAMIDSKLTVKQYRRAATGEIRYFCEDELGDQQDKDRWKAENDLKTSHGISGIDGMDLDLVRHLSTDYDEFKRLYNLKDEPSTLQPPWATMWVEQLAEFLAQPFVAGMLLFGAWFLMSTEMSAPGLSVPGFLSAVCFMLFFWSQFLNGTADWFELLLFGFGVTFVILEIFVVPGFGIFGIGGAIMLVVSIVLMSQTFVIPQNSYQLSQLPASLSMSLFAIGGVIVALVVMRHTLPNMPMLNRLMLPAKDEDELDELKERESLVNWEHLSGKRGTTTTQLTPSGKASFGDDVVDVVSTGDVVPKGADIYVAEVRGNRVVVKPIVSEDL